MPEFAMRKCGTDWVCCDGDCAVCRRSYETTRASKSSEPLDTASEASRLTYNFPLHGRDCWQVKGADNATCSEVCRAQGDNGCFGCPIDEAFDRLAEYEDGIEHGRIVKIPCKIGDTVFALREFKGITHIQETKVSEMYFTHDMRLQIVCKYVCRGEWGKRVFGTYEEAKAAIRKEETA